MILRKETVFIVLFRRESAAGLSLQLAWCGYYLGRPALMSCAFSPFLLGEDAGLDRGLVSRIVICQVDSDT